MSTVLKSLLTALTLLVGYQLALPHLPRKFYTIPGQQRRNFDTAQRYLLEAGETTSVVVGSSMAMMLNEDLLGPSVYKLTMGGTTAFTGLEIIRRSGKRPAVVLIEVNLLFKQDSEDILDNAFGEPMRTLREPFSMFRERGRPSCFVSGVLEAATRKAGQVYEKLARFAGEAVDVSAGKVRDPDLRAQILKLAQAAYDRPIPEEFLNAQLDRLEKYVTELTGRGCRCVLFEMPMDPAIAQQGLPSRVRKGVAERFANSRSLWLPVEGGPYVTSDGIHLTRAEADRFTRMIMQRSGLEQLLTRF